MTRRPSRVATALVAAAILLCQFSFAVQLMVGAKIAYPAALALLAVAAVFFGRISTKLVVACGVAALVAGQVLLQDLSEIPLPAGWQPATLAYTAFPVLVLAIDLERVDLRRVWWTVVLTVVPSVLGLALQLGGVRSPLLTQELTSTLATVHPRYNSVYGVSLLFGMCGAAQLSSALFLLGDERRPRRRALLLALAAGAVLCVVLSYARRAYLATAVALALSLVFGGAARPAGRRLALRLLGVLVPAGLLLGASLSGGHQAAERFRSSFDFARDEGNALRASKWVLAGDAIAEHPVLGNGPGSLTSVGKSSEQMGAAEDARVAEMLYLAILADLGAVSGVLLIALLLVGSLDSLRRSGHQRLFTAPIVVEGIAGVSAFNPFVLIVFLLALSRSRLDARSAREDVGHDSQPEPPLAAAVSRGARPCAL